MITAELVRAERQRRGMSRRVFAELVGLTPTKIANIEHGRAIRDEEQRALSSFISNTQSPTVDPTIFFLDEDEELMLLDPDSVDEVPASDQPSPVEPPSISVTPPHPAAVITEPVAVSAVPHVDQDVPGVDPAEAATPQLLGKEALHINGCRRVSNSELQTFKHCRRRWWFGWYRGLKLKQEKFTGALSLGDRVHRALAAYYVPAGQISQDPRDALEVELAADELKLVLQVQDRDAADASTVLVLFKKDADLARAMIEGYVQWLGETGADQDYVVDAPEQQLTAIIETAGKEYEYILLTGKLDVRIHRRHDDVRLFIDHKTTGDFDKLTRLLLWDEQMKTYMLLEELNRTPEEPRVEGALYNMLRKVKRTERATPPFYQRVEVRRNVFEIERFKTRLVGEAMAIQQVESCLDQGVDHQLVAFPTPSDRCLWGCEYAALCPMFDDNSRAEDFISEHYIQVNPLQRYDDEVTV